MRCLNMLCGQGIPVLARAVHGGLVQLVEVLLSCGADIHAADMEVSAAFYLSFAPPLLIFLFLAVR